MLALLLEKSTQTWWHVSNSTFQFKESSTVVAGSFEMLISRETQDKNAFAQLGYSNLLK